MGCANQTISRLVQMHHHNAFQQFLAAHPNGTNKSVVRSTSTSVGCGYSVASCAITIVGLASGASRDKGSSPLAKSSGRGVGYNYVGIKI